MQTLRAEASSQPQQMSATRVLPGRDTTGGGIRTFLRRVILVFHGPCLGYLLMEEMAVNSTYETWTAS